MIKNVLSRRCFSVLKNHSNFHNKSLYFSSNNVKITRSAPVEVIKYFNDLFHHGDHYDQIIKEVDRSPYCLDPCLLKFKVESHRYLILKHAVDEMETLGKIRQIENSNYEPVMNSIISESKVEEFKKRIEKVEKSETSRQRVIMPPFDPKTDPDF